MALSDWNLEASEEAGQIEELNRQKAERLREAQQEEEWHEKRQAEHERLIKLLERDIRNVEKATRFPERIRTERITELKRQISMHKRGVQP